MAQGKVGKRKATTKFTSTSTTNKKRGKLNQKPKRFGQVKTKKIG
jgi:hypothetical protein